MRASHLPNPRAHVGMRVVCVRPRPNISLDPLMKSCARQSPTDVAAASSQLLRERVPYEVLG
eukprot:5099689-Prymnesium_polylepis.1